MRGMEERRKWKRYPVAYPVEVADGRHKDVLTLRDLSKGGVAVVTSREASPEEKIGLRIFLKSRMFHLDGTVVHSGKNSEGKYSIGVKFSEPPVDFHEVLDREIEEMTQYHRECNLYDRRGMTFKNASREYLSDPASSAGGR